MKMTFFHPLGYGWSETWYKNTELTSLSAFFLQSGQGLMKKRAAMLSQKVILETVSCSFSPVPKGDSYLTYQRMAGQLPPSQNPAPGDEFSDVPWTGILGTFWNSTDQYRKNVFTRGQPDDVIAPNGTLGTGPGWPAFEAAANAWIGYITNNDWGWMRNASGPKKTITDIGPSPDDDTLINILTAPGAFPDPGPDPVYARVRVNFPKTKTEANGAWTVQVLNDHSCNIITPMALFPITTQGTLIVYTPTFQIATDGQLQKSTERRAGRPLYRIPGRSRPRIRG
jgi:hypothetical protein